MPMDSNPQIDQCCLPDASADKEGKRGQGPDRRMSRVDRRNGLERRVLAREASNYKGPQRRLGEDDPAGKRRAWNAAGVRDVAGRMIVAVQRKAK